MTTTVSTSPTTEPGAQTGAPERFDLALLQHPLAQRLVFFEQHCLIAHPRMLDALELTA